MNRHSVNPVVVKKQLHIGSLALDHLPWLSGGIMRGKTCTRVGNSVGPFFSTAPRYIP
jgi:hypothetical protein